MLHVTSIPAKIVEMAHTLYCQIKILPIVLVTFPEVVDVACYTPLSSIAFTKYLHVEMIIDEG